MKEETRQQIEEAKRLFSDVGGSSDLSDEDLVWLTRRNSLSDGLLAELARRQIKASAELREALETTSGRLYWLNVVLVVYTIALLVTGLVAVLLAHR